MADDKNSLSCLLLRTSRSNWIVPVKAIRELIRIKCDQNISTGKHSWIQHKGQKIFLLNPDQSASDQRETSCKLIIFRTQKDTDQTFAVQIRDMPKMIDIRASNLEIVTTPVRNHPFAATHTVFNQTPAIIPDLTKMQQTANLSKK